MEWTGAVNAAIDYIESLLDGEIDLREVVRIACCSPSKFQRLFLFVTDVTLTEYIRMRRMSRSAEDLLESDIKIVDLALKYGYDSPEAFTRAFHLFHGYPPSVTRKFGAHRKYERLTIQVNIHGGHGKMDTKQDRMIIENVRPIGWGQTSANPYVGAVTACLDALGEGNDFRYAGMISGMGFAYTWSTVGSNDMNMVDDAMISRTFDALGFRIRIYRDGDTGNSPPSREKAFYMEEIVRSIDRGYPVLGFGFTTGEPYASAILGYEDGGQRLYLRSYWDGDVPIGVENHHQTAIADYQVMDDWYANCRGIVVLEERVAPALDGKRLLKQCLQAAVELSEQKTIQFYDLVVPGGLAAYDTMIAVLEDDAYWEMRDDVFLREMDKQFSCVGLLLADHYRNWIARYWLVNHIDASEAGERIEAACENYALINWLTARMIGERRTFLENPLDLEKRTAREDMIPFIKIVKRLDESAVECLKEALALL